MNEKNEDLDDRIAIPAHRRETTKSNPASRARRLSADAEPLEANVIIISHPEDRLLGSRYRLPPGGSLEIGRSDDADISLADVPSVSRNHARLEYLLGSIVLRDLSSTNGTFINGHRLKGPAGLSSGDRFQVGAVHFKFLHERDVEHAYHDAIFDLVTRDGLTEIFNKRKFDDEFEREFARARRYGRPLSLILIDVDHFKNINDTRGHLAGDSALKQIAASIAAALRTEQIFARLGGEEFGILCPETRLVGASQLADKLRRIIGSLVMEHAEGVLTATCSFGVAELAEDTASTVQLFAAADRALYAAKRAGRNRVEPAAPAGPEANDLR